MTLQQNIDKQNELISEIHFFGITEPRLLALETLLEQEQLFLTFTLGK